MTLDDDAIADLQDNTEGVLWFDDDDHTNAPSYTIQLRYKIGGDTNNTRVLHVRVRADGRMKLHGIGGGDKFAPVTSAIKTDNATGLDILKAIDWLWGIER